MLIRLVLTIASVASLAGRALLPAKAETGVEPPSLPSFALGAPPSSPSPWTGLYVGTEVLAVTGGKGVRGGFGGSGYAGYNREFDNGLVLGVQGNLGYTPAVWTSSAATGFNFATTDVRVGYDMGRLMPFVTLGVGLAQPNLRSSGYTGANAVASDLFNSTGNLRDFETAGAGFAYKLTDKLTVELAVQAFRGNGFVAP